MIGIVFLLLNNKSQSTPNNNQPSTSSKTNSDVIDSELVGIKLIMLAGWASTEKENEAFGHTVELEQKESGRKLTIIKNYIGGAAGFKKYKPTEKTTINGSVEDKSFLTEDSNQPKTISMFISTKNKEDEYLIIGNWKINDPNGENEINQILKTLEFK